MKVLFANKKVYLLIVILVILVFLLLPKKVYYAIDFNIEVIKSESDYDLDGIDDYTDIMLGARKDALARPKYKSAYYAGGYPPGDEGVCTDLIWRAFREAGYELKDLIDNDIKNNPDDYYGLDKVPDPNIDFRRVSNLKVFFQRNAVNLSLDINDISSFQPGDIITFADSHIAIVSDKRNKKGIPYLIHNAGQLNREDNTFEKWFEKYGISGHFRWENSSGKVS